MGNSPQQNQDGLIDTEHPPHREDAEETQAGNGIDTRKSKRIKLSARGLELLAALSRKRISITDIDFGDESSQDGGTFADVLAATLMVRSIFGIWLGGRRRVAVKKLRLINDITEEKWFCDFVNELRVLDKLSHPNIVEMIGFVEDIESRTAWLVFPWEENGNLRQFLRSGAWELPERVSLIADVTAGLEYLHSRQPPIRHGDLKSLNILVNSSNRAVITDFGSARAVELGATSAPNTPSRANETAQLELTVTNGTLTLTGPGYSVRWASPECLMENPLDLASDIWALGWIAWEAITDRFPFEELGLEFDVTMRVLEGQLPLIYNHRQLSQIHRLCGLMQTCWKLDPRERPSATDCRKTIGWIPQAIPSTKVGKQSTISSAQLLLKTGQICSLQCRWKEALGIFEQGLALARSTGDQATLANLLLEIADVHEMGSKYVEAEASYREVLAICKIIGYDRGRAHALRGLGAVRIPQSKYIEAEAFYAESLAICKIIRDDEGRADALQGLGAVRNAQSKYVEAEAFYAESLAICKTVGYDIGLAYALRGLGTVRIPQSKYIEAEASYAESLAICEIIRNDVGRGNALRGLGKILGMQSKYNEAEASYAEALAIYKTIGDDVNRSHTLEGLGNLQIAQCKYIEAEASYAEALTIYKTIGDDGGRAKALRGLGNVRRAQSKYIEAEASYTEALAIYKHLGQALGRMNCSIHLAELWIHQARYTEAKALVDDVISLPEEIGYARDLNGLAELLGNILEAERSPNSVSLTSALPA